ncbi:MULTISPECIES: hypothetical protein [Hydrocarboniphaga]|uniref:hypothetical protein n=1 Tax=Hydrocarboniphaga TaxID=243627 RepID=UPI0012FC24F4|nr:MULTISPECIES: hypothetical protein [Hydrocarboniphaga]MDZ4077212.1 hypothetical protein [Hydrocarboniphaga sp.]
MDKRLGSKEVRYAVAVQHPTEDRCFSFSLSSIEPARQGERNALARVLAESALAIRSGFPLPEELAEFMSSRLLASANLVGAAGALDPKEFQAAMLGPLPRGAAARRRVDIKSWIQLSHQTNRALGRTAKESFARIEA